MKTKVPGQNQQQKDATEAQTRIALAEEARAAENDRLYREVVFPRVLEEMERQGNLSEEFQQLTTGWATEDRDRLKDTTWRLQDDFIDEIDAYDAEAEGGRMADKAVADVEQAFSQIEGQNTRELNRMGINPNSGRAMAGQRQVDIAKALGKAQAGTQATEAARDKGLNLKSMAAGFGVNLGSDARANLGLSAQTSGMGMQGLGFGQNSMQSSGAASSGHLGRAQQGWGTVGNWGNMQQQMQFDANRSNVAGFNKILGTGLGMFAMRSERRIKRMIRVIGERLDGLKVYEFRYIWGGPLRRGLMVEEVERVRPEAVFTTVHGYRAVNYSMMGGV